MTALIPKDDIVPGMVEIYSSYTPINCCFYIQISILEMKIKCARHVLANRFAWFKVYLKGNFLSYLVAFVFCSYVNPLQSYHCC